MNNENRSDRRPGTGGRAWRRDEPPRYTDINEREEMESSNLDISQRKWIGDIGNVKPMWAGAGPLERRGKYLRERERESHAVSMDRKGGLPSSQPVWYSSKGSLETVPIDWSRLTRGERRVMRMGESTGSHRTSAGVRERWEWEEDEDEVGENDVCSCGGKAKGAGGVKRQASDRLTD